MKDFKQIIAEEISKATNIDKLHKTFLYYVKQ